MPKTVCRRKAQGPLLNSDSLLKRFYFVSFCFCVRCAQSYWLRRELGNKSGIGLGQRQVSSSCSTRCNNSCDVRNSMCNSKIDRISLRNRTGQSTLTFSPSRRLPSAVGCRSHFLLAAEHDADFLLHQQGNQQVSYFSTANASILFPQKRPKALAILPRCRRPILPHRLKFGH